MYSTFKMASDILQIMTPSPRKLSEYDSFKMAIAVSEWPRRYHGQTRIAKDASYPLFPWISESAGTVGGDTKD